MRYRERTPSSSRSRPPGGGDITAANYVARACSFVASNAGTGFVVRAFEGVSGSIATRQPVTEAQWMAWMSYFAKKDIRTVFARRHGMMTVPAEWPEEFDRDAPPSSRFAKLPNKKPPPVGWEERAADPNAERVRVTQGFQAIGQGAPPERPRPERNPTPDERGAKYRSSPVAASDALLAACGRARNMPALSHPPQGTDG